MNRKEFITYIKSIGFEKDISRISSFYLDVYYVIVLNDDYVLYSYGKELEYDLNNLQPLIKITRKYKLKKILE